MKRAIMWAKTIGLPSILGMMVGALYAWSVMKDPRSLEAAIGKTFNMVVFWGVCLALIIPAFVAFLAMGWEHLETTGDKEAAIFLAILGLVVTLILPEVTIWCFW